MRYPLTIVYMEKVEKNEVEQSTASEATTEENKDQSTRSEASQTQTEGIDYKAKLEAERQRREKAEAKLVDLKKEKKEANSEEEREDIDARIKKLEDNFEKRLEEKTRELEMRSEERRYSDAISSVASSTDEAELIKHILKNDIKPTGDIERDVRRAKLLANEDNLTSENEELKKALTARKTAGGISTSGQRVREEKQTWTAADHKFAQAAGLDLSKVGKRK